MARSKARSGSVKSGSSRAVKKKAVRWNGAPGLKGQRRETILRSVANVLRNSGLSSLTIQEIADELGMTKGNLYYYFKDKQDILYQCHMRCMDISLRALKQAMAADGTAGEKLRILLVGHIHGMLDDGFGSILQTDLESFWPAQRKQYVSKRDQLERGVRSLIEDGLRSGEFECDNVKLAGFSILGAHQLDSEVVSAERAVAGSMRSRTAWWNITCEACVAAAPRETPQRGGGAATARTAIIGCLQLSESWR